MKTTVTEKGLLIPKKFLKGMRRVEIRKENEMIVVVPIDDDPITRLGENPIMDDVRDASENHDSHLYGR